MLIYKVQRNNFFLNYANFLLLKINDCIKKWTSPTKHLTHVKKHEAGNSWHLFSWFGFISFVRLFPRHLNLKQKEPKETKSKNNF